MLSAALLLIPALIPEPADFRQQGIQPLEGGGHTAGSEVMRAMASELLAIACVGGLTLLRPAKTPGTSGDTYQINSRAPR